MKRYTLIIFSVLAAFVFLAACSGNGGASSSLKITADELDREVQKTVSQYEAQGMKVSEEQKAQLREAVLTQMVERKLLLHEAQNSGVKLDQEKFETEFASIKTKLPHRRGLCPGPFPAGLYGRDVQGGNGRDHDAAGFSGRGDFLEDRALVKKKCRLFMTRIPNTSQRKSR